MGTTDDTFLHLVDAWWEGEIHRRGAASDLDDDVDDEIQEGFDAFVACKGDSFRNSDELAMHIEEWVSLFGGDEHPEGQRLLTGVLAFWRSMEPKGRAARKPGAARR